tara:strand:- start:7975 stop:8619 length:645 start_codon:yes stop_codon:yes gene_type:complete
VIEVSPGRRFGRWLVVEEVGYKQKYKCVCACGRERNIRVYDLLKGKTRMCRFCSSAAKKSQHGHTANNQMSSEYTSWVHMNQRCNNPKNKSYPRYGGKGIEVFSVWRNSFEAFFLYLGPKPTPAYTIERIDYKKGYVPGNVRWATRHEQALNKSDNVVLEIDGLSKTVSQWAKHPACPVPAGTIYKRLYRSWDPRDAVFTPSQRAVKNVAKNKR